MGLPVLTYHSLDTTGSVVSTDPRWFAETMAALADAGFRAIDLETWIDAGRPDVDRAFAITFDDGLRSIRAGIEVLAALQFPVTVFLVTGRMGSDNGWPGQPRSVPRQPTLGWPEIDNLARLGIAFGAHSRTHPYLTRLGDRELEAELRDSQAAIEDRTGRACRLFAYPYGAADDRVRLAASARFAAAFGTRPASASRAESLHGLSRFDAYDLRSPRSLRWLLDGTLGRRLRLRRAVRSWKRGALALTRGGAT